MSALFGPNQGALVGANIRVAFWITDDEEDVKADVITLDVDLNKTTLGSLKQILCERFDYLHGADPKALKVWLGDAGTPLVNDAWKLNEYNIQKGVSLGCGLAWPQAMPPSYYDFYKLRL